jgi:hypothetical protein
MDPTQNPTPGGQPPAVDLSNIEKMIGDLNTSVETKLGEFDTKIDGLASENSALREIITQGGNTPPTPPPTEGQPGWQPKSWDDFPALVDQKAREIIAETVQKGTEEQQRMSAEQQRVQQSIDREIDNQLDGLTREKILPPINNARDPNDPGNVARKELLALGVKLETPNLDAVAREVLVPAHERGETFDPTTQTWLRSDPSLAGKYAPVGSSSSRTNSGPTGPSYDVIRKARTMDDLIAYADQNGYGPVPPQA